MSEYVMVPRRLAEFLLGQASWDGRDFGDGPEPGRHVGRYWWRSDLRAALSAPAPQGIGREEIALIVAAGLSRFEEASGPADEEAAAKYITEAILALLTTEPPAQGEGHE